MSSPLRALLMAACLAVVAAQRPRGYSRPRSFSEDCVVETQATLRTPAFPRESYLTGDASTTTDLSTTITVAEQFTVEYFPNYKVVTNLVTEEVNVLYECGTDPPTGDVVKGVKVFQIPLTSVMLPEPGPSAFLEILNVTDRVHSASLSAVSACAQLAVECNRTALTSEELSNARLVNARAIPFVDSIIATGPLDPPPPNAAPIFTFSGQQDTDPLDRAKWIKFLGLFFNKEAEASAYYDGVASRYNSQRDDSINVPDGERPVVAWIAHLYDAPDEHYQLTFRTEKDVITKDAGGTFTDQGTIENILSVQIDAFNNDTYDWRWGSNITFANKTYAQSVFLNAIKDVDIVIDETAPADPASYTLDSFLEEYGIDEGRANGLKFLSGSPKVFRTDGLISPGGAYDINEGGVANPDKVLADYISAFSDAKNGADLTGRSFTWVRNIEQQPVVLTADDCKAATTCAVRPTPICPFISSCPNGQIITLQSAGSCEYSSCSGTSVSDSFEPSPAPSEAEADIQAASPAIAAAAPTLAAVVLGALTLLLL